MADFTHGQHIDFILDKNADLPQYNRLRNQAVNCTRFLIETGDIEIAAESASSAANPMKISVFAARLAVPAAKFRMGGAFRQGAERRRKKAGAHECYGL